MEWHDDDIFPGGYGLLMKFLEKRQIPYKNAEEVVPPLDVDLDALWHARVSQTTPEHSEAIRFDAREKHLALQKEFEGEPRLLHLHAVLIALSRRTAAPERTLPLFFRIWREQGKDLANALSVRWLISACTTFADCGETGDQRALGMGLSTLFDMIKLHDSERRSTGKPCDEKMKFVRYRRRPPLGLGMEPYSIEHGDLDKNVLARLWQLSEREPTMRPLAVRMLRMLMTDRGTIFARMQAYKGEI